MTIPTLSQPKIWGFYHDPPIWIESEPIGLDEEPVPLNAFSEMQEEVLRINITDRLEFRATREGLFAFDFSNWPEMLPTDEMDQFFFEHQVSSKLAQVSMMNAFLAFVYTFEFQRGVHRMRMLVAPDDLLWFFTFDGRPMTLTVRLNSLFQSSDPATYNPGIPTKHDPRLLLRQQTIPVAIIENAVAALGDLISRFESDGAQLADLFLRASKEYQEYDYPAAMITNWAITEKMLQELWEKYLADNRTRDGEVFINSDRKKRLQDGRTYSASVLIELLSLLEIIDSSLFSKLMEVRKMRNDWIHSLNSEMTHHDAFLSTEVCESMLGLTRNIELSGQRLLML